MAEENAAWADGLPQSAAKSLKGREAAQIHGFKIWISEVAEATRLTKTKEPLVCQSKGLTGGCHHEQLLRMWLTLESAA